MLANNLLRKMDEIAAKQRQREEEAEARRAAAKISARATAPIPVNTEPETAQATPWRPSGGSWRDREAAKLAGTAANGESSPAPAAPLSERPRFNLAKPTISRDRESSPPPTAPPSERPRLNLAKPTISRDRESSPPPPSERPRLNLARSTISRDRESSPPPTAPPSERPRLNLAKPTISRDQARIPERLIERDVPEQTSTPAENKAPKLGTYVPPGLRRKQLEVPQSSTPPPQEDKTQSSWGRGMGRRDVSDSKQ